MSCQWDSFPDGETFKTACGHTYTVDPKDDLDFCPFCGEEVYGGDDLTPDIEEVLLFGDIEDIPEEDFDWVFGEDYER